MFEISIVHAEFTETMELCAPIYLGRQGAREVSTLSFLPRFFQVNIVAHSPSRQARNSTITSYQSFANAEFHAGTGTEY